MSRGVCLVFLFLFVCMNINAQGLKGKFKVMEVTPNGVMVAGKVVEQYDTLELNGTVVWLKSKAHMNLKSLANSFDEMPIYKGNVYRIYCGPEENSLKRLDLFWWIKHYNASYKGPSKSDRNVFDGEHFMYEDSLVIELPEKLSDGEGYEFVSQVNGMSFYSANHEEYPLILITKKMLDSIGCDGEMIKLKVLFINNNNKPRKISDSMIIRIR